MDSPSKVFNEYLEQFEEKLNKVNEAFNEIQQKSKDCENFLNNIAKPNNWYLNNDQKDEEKRLFNVLIEAIEQFGKAKNEFDVLNKTHLGISC